MATLEDAYHRAVSDLYDHVGYAGDNLSLHFMTQEWWYFALREEYVYWSDSQESLKKALEHEGVVDGARIPFDELIELNYAGAPILPTFGGVFRGTVYTLVTVGTESEEEEGPRSLIFLSDKEHKV